MYAFGVLLWEMCMGEPAWRDMTEAQITYGLSSGRVLSDLPDSIPAETRNLVVSCFASAAERPTMVAVAAELGRQLSQLQDEATVVAPL